MLIHEDYINRRIDKFLRDNFGYLQSKICILAKQKKILINNEPQKFDYRLQKGDKIDVLDDDFTKQQHGKNYFHDKKNSINKKSLKYENIGKNKNNKKTLPIEMIYKLKQSVVFEDDNVLVINKPYGVSVQGGTGVRYNLEDYFSILCEKKLRIVHRIDKDTRGLLILAKNVPTAVKLTEMFKQRLVHKKYLAVLSGIPLKNSGTIKTHIVLSNKDNMASNAHCMEDRLNGKPAITKYRVLKTNKNNNTALVEFFPLTGRKHQIRLHAQNIKCPIIGDEKYGFGKQKNKKLQLFAVAIDASPVVKVELDEKEINKMIDFE